ncbi:MAG: class I SAM-dependent methyltransferase [Crocinitomicaceae bacterium]|nr:class I SAM-dependent methyltransferase [Crocinitomicaceae bacterium]
MTNLMQFGDFAPGTRILDLACGKGRHSVYLNNLGYHVTGMDLSAASIQEASKFQNEKLVFLRQDMRDPLPLIIMTWCLTFSPVSVILKIRLRI